MSIILLILKVSDSKGHTLFNKDDAKNGKFAFTTEDYEVFEVCFSTKLTGESCSVRPVTST